MVALLGTETRPRMIVRGLARGYRICVSPSENLGYLLGTAESHLQRAIKKYVSAGDMVFDIGANIGYVSLSLAKRVGPNGRVIAFEPIPRNVEMLRKSIEVNGLTNIQLLDLAASDRDGETVIRMAENPATASMIWHQGNPDVTNIVVKTVAIDDLVDAGEFGRPIFVKIDVEGAEGLVLAGMRRTIEASQAVLFVECSDAGREAAWKMLTNMGYRCQSALTLRSVNTFEEYRHSDFLWLPAARAA